MILWNKTGTSVAETQIVDAVVHKTWCVVVYLLKFIYECESFGTWVVALSLMDKQLMVVVSCIICLCRRSLGMSLPNLKYFAEAQIAAHRIFKMIDRVPEIDSDDTTGSVLRKVRGNLELVDVAFAYPSRSEQQIFKSLNLTIPAGLLKCFTLFQHWCSWINMAKLLSPLWRVWVCDLSCCCTMRLISAVVDHGKKLAASYLDLLWHWDFRQNHGNSREQRIRKINSDSIARTLLWSLKWLNSTWWDWYQESSAAMVAHSNWLGESGAQSVCNLYQREHLVWQGRRIT